MALYKTRGVVLNYIRYGESSIITRILTDAFGVQSYIVNSVRTKKPKFSVSFFQPFTLLNMVVYYKKNASLNRIAEISPENAASTIPLNIYKSGIALFLAETLVKTLTNELEDREMFEFVYRSVQALDDKKADFENFHLHFLIELSKRLGFEPHSGSELLAQAHNGYHEGMNEQANLLDRLISGTYDDAIKMSSKMRRLILDDLIRFYRIHIENFGSIKSLEVLKATLG